MINWGIFDTDNCCLKGTFDDIHGDYTTMVNGVTYPTGIHYFPSITNGVIEETGLYNQIKSQLDLIKSFTIGKEPTTAWLYITYLLKTSVCYVEYKGFTGQLKKMLLCSNISLLEQLGYDCDDFGGEDVNGGVNEEIRAIKINPKKLTVPRTPLTIKNAEIRIVPIKLMFNNVQNIKALLEQNSIVQFDYYKDNGTTRSLVTTQNLDILLKHYDRDTANNMLLGTSYDSTKVRNNGYIRLPELGASCYDSGVRALNVAKITGVKTLKDEEVDYRFVNVNIDEAFDVFKRALDTHLLDVLQIVAKHFEVEICDISSLLRARIYEKIENNILIGSTEYKRKLYSYMFDNPVIFGGVTGVNPTVEVKEDVAVAPVEQFNFNYHF